MAKLKIWDGDAWEQIPDPAEIDGAVAAAIDAEPRIAQLVTDVAALDTRVETVAPAAAPQPSEFAANIQGQTVWMKLPYLDPTMSQYGLSETGTPLDNSAIIQNIAAQAVEIGATVKIPAGEFPISRVDLPNNVVFEGAGRDKTRFLKVNDAQGAAPAFRVRGSLGPAIPILASTASYATSVSVATNPGLVPGDLVYVTDKREPWGGGVYPSHDIVPVMSVTGAGPYTINFGAVLYHPFIAGGNPSATVQKISQWNGKMHGFTVDVLDGALADVIRADWSGHRTEIGDIGVEHWGATAVRIIGGYMSKIDRVYMADPPVTNVGGRGYGVRLEMGTRGVDVGHSEGRNTRHSFDISYGSSANIVHDSFGYNAQGGSDFGCHGAESYDNSFVGNTVYSMTTNQGFGAGNNTFGGDFNTTFDRCKFYGLGQTGPDNAAFAVRKGSTGTKYRNCHVEDAYYGVHAHRSDDISIVGSEFIRAVDAAYLFNSSRAVITGNQFRAMSNSAVSNMAVDGNSNYILAANNVLVGSTTRINLSYGTGHVTTPNVEV